MNFERAAMKGKLTEAKENKMRLANKFEALAAAIRQGLNTALTDIEDIEMLQISSMCSDLEVAWAELLSCKSNIARLEKELN